jgi:hypothetical protein
MASSSQSVLRLYREMLRNASKFEVRSMLGVQFHTSKHAGRANRW